MSSIPAKSFLIVGKANAGKTLFLLNFAEYMGYNELTIKIKGSIDETMKSDTIDCFKKGLVSDSPNTTRNLQVANIVIPVFKGKKQVEFIDSTGISPYIHFDQNVRDGMVQTLTLLKEKSIIFHVIDAVSVSQSNKIDDIDMEVYKYGKLKGNYLIVANKADLSGYDKGFKIIVNSFDDAKVVKVSALLKSGFNEVKKYVSKIA